MNHKYCQLFFGSILLLLLGTIYAWSIFVEPLEEEFGWKRDQTSLIFTLTLVFFCVGNMAGGMLSGKFNRRILMIISAFAMAFAFYLSSNVTELWQICISHGVIYSICTGALYNIAVSSVNSWFDNVGFSSGVMLMCYGFGSMALGPAVSACNNLFGWRSSFVFLGIVFSVVILLCSVFLRCRPFDDMKASTENCSSEQTEFSPAQMVREKTFHLYYIWSIFAAGIGVAVIGQASPMVSSLDVPDYLPVLAVGALSVANGIGRVVCGILYSLFGRNAALMTVVISYVLGVITVNLALPSSSTALIFVGFIFIGAGYGACQACSVIFTKLFFGEKNYSKNLGILGTYSMVASFLGSYVMGLLVAKTGSYISLSLSLLALTALMIVFALLLKIYRDKTAHRSL